MRPGRGLDYDDTPTRGRKAGLAKKLNRIVKASTPERSEAYLAFIRTQPCIVTGARSGIEAHHWSPKGDGAMGRKPDDFSAVPLHALEHRYWHAKGVLRGMTRAESEALMVGTQRLLRAIWESREGTP